MKRINQTTKYWICLIAAMMLAPQVMAKPNNNKPPKPSPDPIPEPTPEPQQPEAYEWSGSSGGNSWTSKDNWKGTDKPFGEINNSLIFGELDTGDQTVDNINKQYTGIKGMSFDNAKGGYALNGRGRLEIDGGYSIKGNGGYTHTFNVDVKSDGVTGLILEGSDNFILNGKLTSSGGLTKSGSGKLTLYGDQKYSGTTTLSGGILGGVFTINDLVHTGGTLAPGNSIGTVTIDNGNYSLGAGAVYEVEVEKAADGPNNDLVNVTAGTATLAAGSTIYVLDISTKGYVINNNDTFSIIQTSDGVTDNGTAITDNSAVLSFTGSVSGNDYILTAARESSFARVVKGLNSNSTMSAIDADLSSAAGDYATVITQLQMLNAAEIEDASKELSPANHAPATTVSNVTTQHTASNTVNYLGTRRMGIERTMLSNLRKQDSRLLLADASASPDILARAIERSKQVEEQQQTAMDKKLKGFIRPFGVFYQQKGTENMGGFSSTSAGMQFGIDRSFGPRIVSGIGGSYSHAFIDFDDDSGEGNVDSYRIGPYATAFKKGYYIDSSVTVGYHRIHNERNIKFGAIDRTAKSDYYAYDLSAYFGAGYDVRMGNWTLTPKASVQYIYYYSQGFKERGADAAGLVVDDRTTNSVRGSLSVNLSAIMDIYNKEVATEMFCGYAHEFIDETPMAARFVDGTAKFTNDIDNDRQNSVYYGAGLSTLLKKNVSAFIRYEGEYSAGNRIDSLNVGITILF